MSHPRRPTVRAHGPRSLAGLVLAMAGVACGAAPVHPTEPVRPVPPAAVEQKPAPSPPKPLGEAARALLPTLRKDVETLVTTIGQRDVDHPWELADAADYLATELEAAGYSLERQGFEVRGGKAVVQNLVAKVSGGRQGGESVVVAAHYDTPPASRGADDNASGTAVLLALARSLHDARPDRAIRFAFLVNEHEPFAGTADMGSLRLARQLTAAGEKVRATIALRAVGGTLFVQDGGPSPRPVRSTSGPGEVIVWGPAWAGSLAARVAQLLARDLSVTVVAAPGTEHALDQDLGVWGFWQAQLPAVLLTRDPDGESSRSVTDDEPPLDFETMAELVLSLRSVVLDLATVDTPASSDQWLAPDDL